MRYASQKIGYHFLAIALLFFLLQISQTIFLGHTVTYSQQLDRVITTLLIIINGAAYYIIPEEAKRNLYSTILAYIHLICLVIINATVSLKLNNSLLTYFVIANFVLVLSNLGLTLWQSNTYTATSMVLLLGLLLAGMIYISQLFNVHPHRVTSDWQRWFTELWVEGIWELIMGALLGFILIKISDARENIEFWLYIMVCFCFILGLLGHSPYSTTTKGHVSWFAFSLKYCREVLHMFASFAFLGMLTSTLLATKKRGIGD